MRPVPSLALLSLFLILLLGGAAAADAQTDPVPVVPLEEEVPDPTTSGDPADPSAEAGTETSTDRSTRWDYSVGVGGGWESNVGLQPTTVGPSDYVGSAFANLSRTAVRPRGQTRFSVAGSTYFYKEQTDFDRWDGSGSFAGSWNLSRRTTGALGLGVHYGHTDNSRILSDQGLVLPLTRTIDYSGNLGLTHRASTRTDIRLNARAYRVDFPESALLRDTTSLRLTAGLDRRIGRYDTLSAEYATERVEPVESTPDTVPYWTHYVSGIWSRVLGRRTAMRIEGGASHTPERETEGLQSWRFYGGISLTRRIEESTNLSAFYRREVLPAFGVGGLRFTDRFGLNAAIPLGRAFQLGLGGLYTRDAEPDADGARLSTVDANASLSARLARRLSLSAEGRYYRRWPFGEFPELDNYRVGLFLVYGSGIGRPALY